jgi:aspartyl-tRNA(Asn)/glutamyl-tRNA(Gln) amidotransferase subunit A
LKTNPDTAWNRLTASELAEAVRGGSCTPEAALRALEAEVKKSDASIRAYVSFDGSRALRKPGVSPSAPLYGVPIAIKDNICVEGEEITCASNVLKGFVAPYHATVVRKLLDAGAVIAGRTNMDEFAFGSSCETSCYGPTRNPRLVDRVPGGSSGGSAAAVANHTAVAALGSDTGGSIRQPAAFCGVVGMKPTYGRVSRYGLVAFASSLDQIGPFTKDVRDSALLLGAIAGHDPLDSTSADVPVPDYASFLGRDVKGLRLGLVKEYFEKGSNADIAAVYENAKKVFSSLGAEFVEISLPHAEYSVNVYYIVAPSEASSNLARFDGVRFGFRDKAAPTLLAMYEESRGKGFGAEAKRRIILGTYSLSSGYYDAYYLRAMKVRTLIKRDFENAFGRVDAIVTPTAPSAAFKLGQKTQNPLEMYLSDIFTISANLAGLPAISVPGAVSADNGLPLGLQLIGKPFDEGTLFSLAHAFERASGLHKSLGNAR